MSTSIIRHNWVEQALSSFRSHFASCGYTIPDNVRVSIGFTKGSTHGTLGQCINKANSQDDHWELFISPIVGVSGDPEKDRLSTINILETIAHEMIHATVGLGCGHRGDFAVCAAAVGFTRPWRYTPAGDKMLAVIEQIVRQQGLFPSGGIKLPKKQGKSLVKCTCEGCGYVAYITAKNLENVGTPICPDDREAMMCD